MVSVFTQPDLNTWEVGRTLDILEPFRLASWFHTLISCSLNLRRVYIRLCKHGNHFTFLHYYIKQIDSKLVCGCTSCATFSFLPHFDVICDLLLNRHTATWNLFVKYIYPELKNCMVSIVYLYFKTVFIMSICSE